MSFTIRRATYEDKSDWLRMRQGLWPEAPIEYLDFDLDDRLADPDYAVFIASREDTGPVAFIETGLRDYGEDAKHHLSVISKPGCGRTYPRSETWQRAGACCGRMGA